MFYKIKDVVWCGHCLIFWWKCLQRYNTTRNEKFV